MSISVICTNCIYKLYLTESEASIAPNINVTELN